MPITGVEPYAFGYPSSTHPPCADGQCTGDEPTIYLVRVKTDDGLVGWGEARIADEANLTPAAEILGDLVIDEDAAQRGLLWHRMVSVASGKQAKEAGPTGRRDFFAVLSAIDVALWDVLGQSLGTSVGRLLGGVRSDRIDSYVTGLWVESGLDVGGAAREICSGGFRGLELRLQGQLDADVGAVRSVRAAVGNQVVLMVDAAGGYDDYETALELGRALTKDDVYWIEEPLRSGRWDEYARLAVALEPPIAAGKTLYGTGAFHTALSAGAMHVAMPDPGLCGGITAARAIAEIAALHEVRVSMHTGVSPVGMMASANVSAAMPYAERLGIDRCHVRLAEAMLVEPPSFEQGFMLFGDRPGLGLEISEEFVNQYRRDIVET